MKPSRRSSSFCSLMRMTPRPGPAEEVDLVDLAEHRARLARGGDDDLVAGDAGDADDLRAFGDAREPPAGARARLDERLEREAQAVAVARHRQAAWTRRRRPPGSSTVIDARPRPRIQAQRGDDLLAVLELEQALDRLAVAGRRRHVGDPRRVRRRRSCVKNTTVARVLPGSTASTASPSRTRVDAMSFTSFCRFTQPSRVTTTTLSSSMMKSSAVYSSFVDLAGDLATGGRRRTSSAPARSRRGRSSRGRRRA